MSDSEALLQLNEALRLEADDILVRKGLLSVLEEYGKPHVVGSYSLHLMVWRDVDLYLETDRISQTDFFEMGGRIDALLNPTNMSFRDTTIEPVSGLPPGLYWGVYLNRAREDSWKIDLFVKTPRQPGARWG